MNTVNTVTCQLCGQDVPAALYGHLKDEHQITAPQYLGQFPGAPLAAPALLLQMQMGCQVRRTPVTAAPAEEFRLQDAVLLKRVGDSPLVPKLDPAYRFPLEAPYLMHALNAKENVLLVGPTGAGKSSLVLQLAAAARIPVRRANLNGETTTSDFLGRWTVQGHEMIYREGLLPAAMRHGDWLLLDEIDAALPQILFVLQSVLEENGKLTLLEKDGEVVEPHPDFRLLATANTLGNGDDTGLYAGTHILNEAFLDRFATVIQLDYPGEAEEAAILADKVKGLKKAALSRLVKFARQVREAAQREECSCTFSTRRLLALARKWAQLGQPQAALDLTVLNKLSPDDRRVVAEIAQRRLGDLLTPNPAGSPTDHSNPNTQDSGEAA